jgi:hypothetical protein
MSTTARDIVHASATTHLQLVADYDDAAATAQAAADRCSELETQMAELVALNAEQRAKLSDLERVNAAQLDVIAASDAFTASLQLELADARVDLTAAQNAALNAKRDLALAEQDLRTVAEQLEVAIADADNAWQQVDTLKDALAACQATQPLPPPPPIPHPLNLPLAQPTDGWKVALTETFDTDCPEGGFRATYTGTGKRLGLYPRFATSDPYRDTRRKQGQTVAPYKLPGGIYTDKQISVKDGICTIRMDVDQETGITRSAAIIPIILPGVGAWGDAPAFCLDVRATIELDPGLKVAWLAWPVTDTNTPDGELDYPEFDGAGPVAAFIHHQGATSGSDQKHFGTQINPRLPHTYRTIWRKGVSVEFLCDGVPIAPVYTTRIPAKDMHIVLQCESSLSSDPVPRTAKGLIRIGGIQVSVPT